MERYKRFVYISLSALILIAMIYLFFKLAFQVIFPFLVAMVISLLTRPIVKALATKTKAPMSLISVGTVLFLSAISILLLAMLLGVVAREIGNIVNELMNNLSKEQNVLTILFDFVKIIEDKLPFVKSLTGDEDLVYQMAEEIITEGIKNASISITSTLAEVIKNLPEIALWIIVFVLSLFYFAKDYDKISEKIERIIPKKLHRVAMVFKRDTLRAIEKCIKSYLLLLLITFAILFSAYLILGVENSFVLALVISIADMLPILGAPIIMLPWAIVMIIYGDIRLGVGLIITSVIVYAVRQYAEPRILSAQMNIHPLVTLLVMYAGFKLLGVWGLLIAPVAMFCIKPIVELIVSTKEISIPEKNKNGRE